MAESSLPVISAGPSSTLVERSLITNIPVLTTTFTPPPECTNSLTMMGPERGWEVWYNEIVPGPSLTFSACYPKVVVDSYLMSLKGTVSVGFNPISCPQDHSTASTMIADKTITHVVCCPTSFSFDPPGTPIAQRPLFGGKCYSDISATSVVTYVGEETSSIFFSTAGQAYALAIDGFSDSGTTNSEARTTPGAGVSTTPASATDAEGTNVPDPDAGETGQPSSGLSQPAKIGIGVGIGGGVVLALLLLGIYLYRRRCKRNESDQLHKDARNPQYAETVFSE